MPPAPTFAASLEPTFPRPFWTANITELFERGAYYAMASFVVIYLGQLGLGDYWPSTLNGLLWTLVYFLPILSGTVADQVGYRRSLMVAFMLLGAGYLLMGTPVWLLGTALQPEVTPQVTATPAVIVTLVAGLIVIGVGGSIVKPCILGTVQKTAGARTTLGFAIFYMVVNIGSLFGRGTAFLVRRNLQLSSIFLVSTLCAALAFTIVLFIHRDPQVAVADIRPRKSIDRILIDMVSVLANRRFALFLVVSSGFFFLYSQVYNVIPLYLKRTLEASPPMDLYTAANPLVIVSCQLAVTRAFGKVRPIRSIVIGTVIIALAMLLNLVPLFLDGGPRRPLWGLLPIGSLFAVLTVGMIAFGELFASARTFEYIGALAPKGQEGLFLGYANLPMAIGSLVGGPVGAVIFNKVMCKGAVKNSAGLLDLSHDSAVRGWLLLAGIGVVSAIAMAAYNVWLTRITERERALKESA